MTFCVHIKIIGPFYSFFFYKIDLSCTSKWFHYILMILPLLHHNRVLTPIPNSNVFHPALFDELGPTASLLQLRLKQHMGYNPWASCQIRKIEACAHAGNFGNSFCHQLQRKPLVSDPSMHHCTCITHVSWCMPGSLIRGGGKNFPAYLAHVQPAILPIWQEAHCHVNICWHPSIQEAGRYCIPHWYMCTFDVFFTYLFLLISYDIEEVHNICMGVACIQLTH